MLEFSWNSEMKGRQFPWTLFIIFNKYSLVKSQKKVSRAETTGGGEGCRVWPWGSRCPANRPVSISRTSTKAQFLTPLVFLVFFLFFFFLSSPRTLWERQDLSQMKKQRARQFKLLVHSWSQLPDLDPEPRPLPCSRLLQQPAGQKQPKIHSEAKVNIVWITEHVPT